MECTDDWRAAQSRLVELEAARRVAERIVRPKAAELVFDVPAYVTTLGQCQNDNRRQQDADELHFLATR